MSTVKHDNPASEDENLKGWNTACLKWTVDEGATTISTAMKQKITQNESPLPLEVSNCGTAKADE